MLTILLEEIQTGRAPCSLAALERPILAALRNLSPEELAKLPDVSEGLEYRIASAVRKTTSLDQLFAEIKTKRYTHARIRRIIVSAFLQMTCDYNSQIPPYLRVLGWNDKGTEILRTARRTASLPIVMRWRRFKKLAEGALTIASWGAGPRILLAVFS